MALHVAVRHLRHATHPRSPPHASQQAALRRVRSDMATRGMGSLGNLGRAFKRTDWNGNKKLDRDEFDDALRSVGVFLKSQELSAVFRAFDMDGSGAVRGQGRRRRCLR